MGKVVTLDLKNRKDYFMQICAPDGLTLSVRGDGIIFINGEQVNNPEIIVKALREIAINWNNFKKII